MARRNKQLIDNRGRLQRILDAEAAANDAAPVVNPFTAIHGNYKVLSKYGDARKAMVNRGGTPVARWIESGALSDSQMAAINHCERLWEKLNGKSLTQDLNKISGIGGGDGWAEQEALDDLKRIKGYFPMKWWTVFECVCRFDEPAGFAGSALTALRNDQVAAARTTVQFVADIIAMNERLSY